MHAVGRSDVHYFHVYSSVCSIFIHMKCMVCGESMHYQVYSVFKPPHGIESVGKELTYLCVSKRVKERERERASVWLIG